MIIATHGIVASAAGFDADAQAFFDRVTTAGGSLSATEKTAVNQLVLDLKGYSIWSKMKAIYPMVGASSAACAQNLKSSSFTGTFNGGWTYASTGVTPNGSTGTFNTGFNPVTESLSVNSNHLAIYQRTGNNDVAAVDIGQNNNQWLSAIRFSANLCYIYNPTNAYTISQSITNSLNLSINTRRSSTDFAYFQNNSKISTLTTSNSASFANANVHIGSAGGSSLFNARQTAYSSIGDGLTDTEAGNLYTAVQAFQTTLSRQVS